jgi:peroxiredoxin Q/BCP
VGNPGPGHKAPGFTLTSSTGDTVSLADYRGKTVLLYLPEGVGCQPCFDQITDLEKQAAKVKAAGIDKVLSIHHQSTEADRPEGPRRGPAPPVLSDPHVVPFPRPMRPTNTGWR